MKLASDERLLKEWNVYSYGKIGKKTDCSLILTNKRVITVEQSKDRVLRSETPLSAVKRWSMKSTQSSGLIWMILGAILCFTGIGLLFGVLCIWKGIRLNKEGSFGLCLRTRRRSSNSLRRGDSFNATGINNDSLVGGTLSIGSWIIIIGCLFFGFIGLIVLFIYIASLGLFNKNQKAQVGYRPMVVKRIRINKAVVNEILEELGSIIIEEAPF